MLVKDGVLYLDKEDVEMIQKIKEDSMKKRYLSRKFPLNKIVHIISEYNALIKYTSDVAYSEIRYYDISMFTS